MKLQLPKIGQIRTGNDVEVKQEKTHSEMLGGFLDFGRKQLSDEKSASEKLINSFDGWVYINVATLAEAVSDIEFELFKFRTSQGEMVMEPIEQHELLDLLNRFNDATTKSQAAYNTEAHLDLAGDSFWLLENGDNNKRPTNIYLLDPTKVDVKLGDFTKQGSRLIEGYTYKVTIDGEQHTREYRPDEVLHIKVPNPGNPYRGKSTVEALASTIDTDNFAETSLNNLFRNGMIADMMLTTEKGVNKEQVDRLQKQLKNAYTGARNAWKIPILGGGLKPEKVQMTGREMQLIELEEWLMKKIMAAFGNSRASLGIDEDVNRATAESSLLHWKRSVVAPKMGRIVDYLNEFLVPRYGENIILGFKDPAPEDETQHAEQAERLFNSGIIDQNEARELVGYGETQGGDEFKVNPLSENGLPKSIKNIDHRKVFRRAGVYRDMKEYKKLKSIARPLAEKYVRKKEDPESNSFTNDQIWKYWEKQINIVETQEELFNNAAEQFSQRLYKEGLSNFTREAAQNGQNLIDQESAVQDAVSQFSPILREAMIISGNHANNLIGVDEPYIPTKEVDTRKELREQIEKFATSMVETDVEKMVNALASGLEEGLSIQQIRSNLEDQIADFTRNQAERVTRTEVLKSSNLGAQDAFEQSGVVVQKQWLTAQDDRVDPLCMAMNGKIVDTQSKFFEQGETFEAGGQKLDLSYSDTPYPPLHPFCRCTIIPVVEGQEDTDIRSYEQFQKLKKHIQDLEEKADKRTREYKEISDKYENTQKTLEETQEYVKELENLVEPGTEETTE